MAAIDRLIDFFLAERAARQEVLFEGDLPEARLWIVSVGATTRELTLPFCRRPEGESRRLDLPMIDPTEQLLENLPRIAAVKTRQRLDFLIPTHGIRNG